MGCLSWGRRYKRALEENARLNEMVASLDQTNEDLQDDLRRAREKIEYLEELASIYIPTRKGLFLGQEGSGRHVF